MAYIGKEPGSGLRGRFIYTATAGQTSFTGADSLGRTLTYTDGEYTDVFLNGVKLDKTDYTATSGTSIVLDSGASADDTLEILAFDTFGLFSGEFAQDVTVAGDLTVSGTTTTAATTMTGDLSLADKIVHTGDTNTAIRFPAADTVTIETAASERVRVDDSGRVGIGESSPDRALDVVGNGVVAEINSSNSNALKLEFSDNGTARSFIGASSSNAFQVADSSGTNLFNITSAGILAIPNLPAFYARGTGTQSFSGTAALQVVQFAGLVQVNNGSDFNTSTYKFTCPVAGIYCFFGSLTTTSAATGVEGFIVNETQSNFDIARVISYGDAFDQGVMIGIDDCAANDVISMQAINNNNTTFDLDLTRCNFGGVLLGAS